MREVAEVRVQSIVSFSRADKIINEGLTVTHSLVKDYKRNSLNFASEELEVAVQ